MTRVGTILSEVQAEPVRWLWPGRVPLGKITVLDGDPGLGKSTISLDLAARVTDGRPMADGSPGVGGGVVLLTAEDGLSDTVKPRLEVAGADLDRVLSLEHVGTGRNRRPLVLPDDLEVIAAAIERIGAVLVVIDPLMAYLNSSVDSHRDQDVRRVLAILAALAASTGAAILLVRHLNKSAVGNPLYRGGGSIGIVGAARSGLVVGRDPEDDTRCILAMSKSNLAKRAPSLAYRVEGVNLVGIGEVPRITWLGPVECDAAELLATPRADRGAPRRDAARWLENTLAAGPVPAVDLQRRAKAHGLAWRTVRRAAGEVGVAKRKRGAPGDPSAGWLWVVDPPKVATSPEDGHNGTCIEVDTLDECGHLRDGGEDTAGGVADLVAGFLGGGRDA